MGGGGASRNDYSSYNLDKSGLDEFAQSTVGKSYGNNVSKLTGNLQTRNDGNVYSVNQDGSSEDFTNLVSDYNKWLAGQATTLSNRKSYLDLAAEQAGRDQTILTGPASQGTLLTR